MPIKQRYGGSDSQGVEITFTPTAARVDITGWYDQIAGMPTTSLSLKDFLDGLGITLKDCQKALKSQEKKKKSEEFKQETLAEIIGEDESSPYFAFWELMKIWPRAQCQKPRHAAFAFRAAVDGGTDARTILEAAISLMENTKYVTRLDLWLGEEGYRLDAPAPLKPVFRPLVGEPDEF